MASNQDFIFTLGADISQFTKSITEVEGELKTLRNVLKTQTGQAIVETNQNIQKLEQYLVNLRKVGLDKLPGASGQGAAALFSLSQVARDAPFGFIAIQNNLPLVIDQFSQLSKTSGGLGGALKQVGAALVGPAGISFAFGAVVAGVTALVQKYGSLGNVIDVIFTKNSKLTAEVLKAKDSYEKYTKELRTSQEISGQEAASVSGQIQKIQALSKIVLDQSVSYEKRNSALNQLKEINKDYFGSLDLEKTKFEDLKGAVDNYTASIIQSSITKGFETEIGTVNVELSKQERLLNKLKEQLDAAKIAPVKIVGAAAQIDTRDIVAAQKAYDAQNIVVKQLRQTKNELNNEITNSINKEIELKVVVDARLEQYKKEQEAQKQADKNKKLEIANNKQLIKDQYKLLEQKKELIDFEVPMAAPSGGTQFDNYLKRLKEQAEIQKKLKKQQLDLENQVVTRGFIQDAIDGFKNIKVPTIEEVIKPEIIQKNKEYTDQLKKQFESVRGVIEQSITAPLDYLFNTILEGGKFSWEEFGKVVIRVLANIVSSIIATTAAAAIANSIVPGSGTAGVGLYNTGNSIFGNRGGQIGPSLGYTPRGLRPIANFGGIGPAGLAMSGAVSLSLRGSDLVGAINRTNTNINRIG